MSTNSNMAIWERVSKTDPNATKEFTRGGGFKGTAIKPHWLVMRATEAFGPVGKGWGWDVIETRVESGMVFCLVQLWYKDGDQRCQVGPQWGGTQIIEKRKTGDFADDECFKKSVTDAVTKGLSYLGFAADVHLGMFDGDKYAGYKAEVTEEYQQKAADEAKAKQLKTDEAFVTGAIAALKAAKNYDELISLGKGHGKRIREILERDAERNTELGKKYADAGKEMREKFQPAEPEAPAEPAQQAAE